MHTCFFSCNIYIWGFQTMCNPHHNYVHITGYLVQHGDSPHFYGENICSAVIIAIRAIRAILQTLHDFPCYRKKQQHLQEQQANTTFITDFPCMTPCLPCGALQCRCTRCVSFRFSFVDHHYKEGLTLLCSGFPFTQE